MAYLLGSETLMESLRTDVQDLQWAISDIFSRIGPVRHSSWKFPDKISCDLDVDDLMDLYSHCEDEEERQVAHIALYELVIDRLVLLVQSLSAFTENTLSLTKSGIEANSQSSGSVGLIVKKYWSRQVHLQTTVQQMISENKTKSRRLSDLESNSSKMMEEIDHYRASGITSASSGFGGLIPPNNAEIIMGINMVPSLQTPNISRDSNNKSSQTVETAFVPCESCSAVQKSFRQTGDVIVSICQVQKIPSTLQKFRPQVEDLDWLSANDVARWAAEQNKDVSRIHKHFENVSSMIEPLKTEVSACEKKCKHLEKKKSELVKELRTEKDSQSAFHRQFDMKVKNIETKCSEDVAMVTKQKNELLTNKEQLERDLDKLKTELVTQHNNLKEIVSEKGKLEKDLKENKTSGVEINKLQGICTELETKLEDIDQKMKTSSKELSIEQAKNKSAAKHSQSLQSKQGSLIQRVDALSQENESLTNQVAVLEEEKEDIEESLKKIQDEVSTLEGKIKEKEIHIKDLMTGKQNLEKSINELKLTIEDLETSLDEAREEEKLLIAYPDLHGPVNQDIQGSGDILLDMDNQVKANAKRIQILEDQNSGLRHSITKVLQLQESHVQPSRQPASAPVMLWNQEDLDKLRQEVRTTNSGHEERSTSTVNNKMRNESTNRRQTPVYERGKTVSTSKTAVQNPEEFMVSKPVRPNSGAAQRRDSPGQNKRPPSGKTAMVPVNSTSIGAYIQIKKSPPLIANYDFQPSTGSVKTESNSLGDAYEKKEMFICQLCDKMYDKARDLEIHKSYCN